MRRILRRLYAIHRGLVEVFPGHLQIMLAGNQGRMADPRTNNMHRPALGQFCFAGGAQIQEKLGPGLQPRLDEDSLKLGPKIGPFQLHNVQDLASRYKYDPFLAASLSGQQVAEHLEQIIVVHGPPLIVKRDRGGNLRHEAVQAVLEKYLIIPLDLPRRYPPYNGAIEHAQREFKELLEVRYHGAERALAIIQNMESASIRARDAAWRRAVESWLHRNGAITVTVDGQVLPCSP